MKPSFTRWLLLLCLCLAPAGLAQAQGLTSASLTGIISDAGGESLPGANVVAVHQPTGTRYGATTREDGRYDLLNMQPGGPYTVTVSFIGYTTLVEEGVYLSLGQTRTLPFTLQESTAQLSEVEILGQGSAILNSDRTGASTSVSRVEIERLPTISRSISDFARLSPNSSGGSSLAGRNNRFNNIQIDGATLNDVFGLSGTGAPGGQAGAQPISLDAIESFNVDIAPFDVRYSGFTGGSINAITRSGTNRFSGSFRYLTRREAFQGAIDVPQYSASSRTWSMVESKPADFKEYYLVGSLGGPIIKNKLFFFVNAELEKEDAPVDAGLAGSGAGNIYPVAESELQRLITIARDKYGYNAGGYDPLSLARDNKKLLAKLDWNISNAHRFTLRHSLIDALDEDGISRSTRNYDLSNRLFLRDEVTNSTVAELRSTLGKNMFNQLRLVRTSILFKRDVKADPFPFVQINTASTGERAYLGIDRFSQANELDQVLYEFTNDFTYVLGKHNLTLGTSNQLFDFRNLFIQDYYGAYEFNSIDDFSIGKPSRYYLSYSQLPDNPTPEAKFGTAMLGFYLQDQFRATPYLTVTGGLRADVPLFLDDPLYNAAGEQAFGYSTAKLPGGKWLFSPRLGFNWDASGGARTTQVRGGSGVFTGRTPFVWISNQYSNTGVDIARVDARSGLTAGFFNPSADPLQQPRPGQPGSPLVPITTAEINITDPDFKFPQVWRSNLAVDQQLPVLGLVATVEGLYTKAVNDITYRNLNLVQQTTNAVDGRPVYGTFSGSSARSSLKDSRFTNAVLMENTDEGYEYSLTVGVRRDSPNGLNGSLYYTRNRAENVNNLTSSRAISNWQFNEAADQNNSTLATADFEVRNRILANVSYEVRYLNRFATSVGLFYEGRSGTPFTWIYNGNVNADTRFDNDPIYVPTSMDEANWVAVSGDTRTPQQIWDEFNAFVEGNESLQEARGTIFERNGARAPWRNILDLQLTQSVNTLRGQKVDLMLNVLNVLNLINSEWGQIEFPSNDNVQLLTFSGYGANGKPNLNFDNNRSQTLFDKSFASRWQMQFGVRYQF